METLEHGRFYKVITELRDAIQVIVALQKERATDPNSTPQQLYSSAEQFPELVRDNPALQWVMIENLEMYENILDRIKHRLYAPEMDRIYGGWNENWSNSEGAAQKRKK